jgi:hypothetical protein
VVTARELTVAVCENAHGNDQRRHVHSPVVLSQLVSEVTSSCCVDTLTTSGGVGLSSGALAKPPMMLMLMFNGTSVVARLVKEVTAAMLAWIRGIDLYLCERSARKPVAPLASPQFLVAGADDKDWDIRADGPGACVVVARGRRWTEFACHATAISPALRCRARVPTPEIGCGDSTGDPMWRCCPRGFARRGMRWLMENAPHVRVACGLACARMKP